MEEKTMGTFDDMMTEVRLYLIRRGDKPTVKAEAQFVIPMEKDAFHLLPLQPMVNMREYYELDMIVGEEYEPGWFNSRVNIRLDGCMHVGRLYSPLSWFVDQPTDMATGIVRFPERNDYWTKGMSAWMMTIRRAK
jgi:hypothetical protein